MKNPIVNLSTKFLIPGNVTFEKVSKCMERKMSEGKFVFLHDLSLFVEELEFAGNREKYLKYEDIYVRLTRKFCSIDSVKISV